MHRRLPISLLLAALLLPLTWLGRTVPPPDTRPVIIAASIVPDGDARAIGPLHVAEAWAISSPNGRVGGLSGLALTGDRRFLVTGDRGSLIAFTLTPQGEGRNVSIRPLLPRWEGIDSESIAVAGDRIWIATEQRHDILRLSAMTQRIEARVRPRTMRRWPGNGGAEAMLRLPDGRFLIFAEGAPGRTGGTAALLFAGDPLACPDAVTAFDYDPGDMGRVTDAALLADGRVLLLHRKVSTLRGWRSTLAVADPATIRAGAMWRSDPVARIANHQLSENYEGLAVSGSGAATRIWLLSDDNFNGLQRTLLLGLDWPQGPSQTSERPRARDVPGPSRCR
jgi:hypothetical protein